MDNHPPSPGNPIPKLQRVAPQSLYGVRDVHGYANLPSRPNSAADSWGKRRDLLKVARQSELMMIRGGKLPERHKLPSPPPTPRLTEDQEAEVGVGTWGRGGEKGTKRKGGRRMCSRSEPTTHVDNNHIPLSTLPPS